MALNLLFQEHVNKILINDIDPAIYAFWKASIIYSDRLIDRIMSTPLTVEERDRQLQIYRQAESASTVDLAFATLFLNRTSISGSLTGGVIGGRKQKGKYKINARFNREDIARRIKSIAERPNRISVYNMDAIDFINSIKNELPSQSLIYFDPPYYVKGADLYRNAYNPDDHKQVAQTIRNLDLPWLLTYDNCPEVKSLYNWSQHIEFTLWYSATKLSSRREGEIMYWHSDLSLPCPPYSRR